MENTDLLQPWKIRMSKRFFLRAQGTRRRGPPNATVPVDLWWVSAEHRGQILPKGHRTVLARGLPELRPVWLSAGGGRTSPLLQAGKKIMSARLSQVGWVVCFDVIISSRSSLNCLVLRRSSAVICHKYCSKYSLEVVRPNQILL